MDPLSLLWLFFILASLQPAVARQALLLARRRALNAISRERGATVITLIHRQETLSLLGFPLVRFIDIDDAESVLRAIRETPAGRRIEIILHTPGGMVIAARQIASALADHDAQVTAVVPHYAMSGGTLIALACDEIVIEPHAALGPVDPQLNQLAAASYVEVAHLLATGTWTHDHPLQPRELQALGLPVRVGVGDAESRLMTLYPQPRGRTPAVEYVPGPGPATPGLPPGRREPASSKG